MLPRAIRAVVIGFPNVGKSALINRLLGKRVVQSAARAGVTRALRWVRISKELELLDAPGVIPLRLDNQEAALKLAICDDIGEASYDNQKVAAAIVDSTPYTGEEYLYALAEHKYQGDVERSARAIFTDYRKGNLGQFPLEVPEIS